jgi:hypothetical protein
MFGWPIWLTDRASWMNRSTASRSSESAGCRTLIAARFAMIGYVAE